MPVLVRGTVRRLRLRQAEIERVARRILAGAGQGQADLSLLFVGDRRMRRLNRTFRRRDSSTDVLAFPMRDNTGKPVSRLLGDVVISLPQAFRQARANGVSPDREVAALLIHGVLHLAGYDHERSLREAERMRRKEQVIMRALGRVPPLVASMEKGNRP
jgi:probable rRNA maturation factor